ncbi:hypothetical protein A6A25_00245 [Saccharothrix sp. CB00851]|nr:hypothetical protein A6A25_00245 [Saccharothrix sp. CB00851]
MDATRPFDLESAICQGFELSIVLVVARDRPTLDGLWTAWKMITSAPWFRTGVWAEGPLVVVAGAWKTAARGTGGRNTGANSDRGVGMTAARRTGAGMAGAGSGLAWRRLAEAAAWSSSS